ncbi:MAG: hypothetical protein GX126_00500 [Bacteroidales bacterium]|jgi:hypothetical protein|nr:hypothetical protein [Bacteroidales bacterium]
MKALPLKIRKNGFNYTQVLRGRQSCIYEQRLHEKTIAFEVFTIKTSPKRKIMGKWIEEKELFPHNEAFGYWAWTYCTLEKAKLKYIELDHNGNKKRLA